jgi:hypothetical protein
MRRRGVSGSPETRHIMPPERYQPPVSTLEIIAGGISTCNLTNLYTGSSPD